MACINVYNPNKKYFFVLGRFGIITHSIINCGLMQLMMKFWAIRPQPNVLCEKLYSSGSNKSVFTLNRSQN